MKRFNRIKNLNGQRFERLLVIGLAPHIKKTSWLCQCDCKQLKIVRSNELIQGDTLSCGCLHKERTSANRKSHGETANAKQYTPEYTAFKGARGRCGNPNNPVFKHYGGRGIEFRFASLEEFLQVLGRRPSINHSLDRIDNDGHYEPGNVQWATKKEQANNRRKPCTTK